MYEARSRWRETSGKTENDQDEISVKVVREDLKELRINNYGNGTIQELNGGRQQEATTPFGLSDVPI